MYLKSIEIQGFKSFLDKTNIQLDNGISCVVGPNGSGKSNIADAVRWVLGEQSAKSLRGHKMEDIIFSGSSKRKPVGMAEVVLNIDNSDGSLPLEFTDVAVCRRAYRSGDSEYLINGKLCRLKDIQNIFLDSGISNNSLCMIGQGRVQQIVDMKPDERRALIEEAAGVIKYRNRKKTAVKKLNDTEKNLERLWDIISELSSRLGPLAEQKEKAERYLLLKEDADKQEINLLLQILNENKIKIDDISNKLKEKNTEISKNENRYSIVNTDVESLKIKLIESENLQNTVRQELFSLKTEKEKAESSKKLLEERLNMADDNINRIENELSSIMSRDDGFISQAEKIKGKCKEKETEKNSLANRIDEQNLITENKKNNIEELSNILEMSRDELFDLAGELANSKNQLTFNCQEIEENETNVSQIKEAKEKLKTEKIDLQKKLSDLQQELLQNQEIISKYQKELGEISSKFQLNDVKIKEVSEQEVKTRMKLNGDQSRLKVLKELAENHDGFYPGVKALLHVKKSNNPLGKNIFGAVIDLIDLNQEYATAIEAALGSAMQNIVVPDDKAAKMAIKYLKEERLGRATFLPVENLTIRNKKELDNIIGCEGVVGRASDIVECSREVRPAIDFLLKNILLVENLDYATKIARENKQSLKIITLEGDVISPGGAISGGSKQRNAGDLLKKKAQLKELERSVAETASANKKWLSSLEELHKENKILADKENDISIKLRKTEMEKISLEKDYNYLKDFTDNAKKREGLYELDLKELELDKERLLKRKTEIEKEISDWEETNNQANKNIQQQQVVIQKEKDLLLNLQQDLEALRLDYVKVEQEYLSLYNEVERLHNEKADLFQQEAEKKSELQKWINQKEDLEKLAETNKEKYAELIACITSKEGSFGDISNAVENEKEKIRSLEKESSDLYHYLAVNKEEVHQMEIRMTRLQTEWDNENQKLAETFELTYDEALPFLDTAFSRSKLSKNVRELRKEILSLGNVNLDSIDEYNEVFGRHEFLVAQRQDLIDAETTLKDFIKEMDAIVVKRFRKAFNDVNENFNVTFNKLFGGGSASLVMTMPDDILETGIDMIVQPPGKKLVNYNLLSGGEKSLIGIALVLAVFHVKPSPFCVLDEVDAALDEANVDRFANYLMEYINKTQFLVVTHRQGTMEVASALWGVTMASEGVSKIVSVKLSDMNFEN